MNGSSKGIAIDHLYLKNVLLKFIVAATQGQAEQVISSSSLEEMTRIQALLSRSSFGGFVWQKLSIHAHL